jgi:hypothetical protein
MVQWEVSAAVAALLVVYGLVRLLSIGRRPKDYPPGPPTLPILGNIHQVSSRCLCFEVSQTIVLTGKLDAQERCTPAVREVGSRVR